MKFTIIVTITALFFYTNTINAQEQNKPLVKKNNTEVQKKNKDKEPQEIRYPKSKKQIIAVIKVSNRHGAKFYHDKKEITYRESLKLVRKKFPNLLVKEDRKKEEIHFTTNKI